ncbi:MAG: glycosyltransferase family 1 protein [Candidatus Komeilibacteria bacterium]|nr:glycosyltransferase family 1 protein [Candidatus Komeilibacteria bacterium]
MLLGLDVSRLGQPNARTGVEWYSYNLLKQLIDIDDQNQYFLYSPRSKPSDLPELPANFQWHQLGWPTNKGWSKLGLSWELLRHKPEILLVPAYVLPPIKNCPQAITWHDFAYETWPESYFPKQRKILIHGWQKVLHQADLILVPSQAVKDYAVSKYPRVGEKIKVTPLGIDQAIFYQRADLEIKSLLNRLIISKPYILFVGRLEAKKNIQNIIKTFIVFNQKNNHNFQLVLAGSSGFGFDKVENLIAEHQAEIVRVEKFNQDELAALYSGAQCLFFPSLAEGFGLPVLEALSCKCPVVASDLPIIHEIGGQAVCYVEPQSINSLINGLDKVVNDHNYQIELLAQAQSQIAKFSWKNTAQLTLSALKAIKL